MADDDRRRDARQGDDSRRDDRGFAGPRREARIPEHEGRGYPRQLTGDVYGGDPGREGRNWEPAQEDREGFWGRGHSGSNFNRDERREYSREDYGASDRGPEERGSSGRGGNYGGSFSQTGEEGRGGQGYGRQRGDFGQEASGRSYVGNEGRGFGYGGDGRSSYGGGGSGGSGSGGGDRGGSNHGGREGGDRGFFQKASDEVSSWFGDRDAEQRREQDYRGKGPKGYKRSDPRIQDDVNDKLADDPYVDASEIEVAVSGGEVTLTGSVDNRQARRRAEDIAEQVSGVSYVQNNIRVRGSGGSGGGSPSAESATTPGAGSAGSTTSASQTGSSHNETAGQNKTI